MEGARGPICLYAVVPASQAHALRASDLRDVVCGPIAALVGRRGRDAGRRGALRHDRIVGRALDVCSSVVPFRFGTDVRSEGEVHDVLALNLDSLPRHLEHFQGRVEMGLKVKLPPAVMSAVLSSGLDRVRVLAPGPADRRERLIRVSTGQVFEGNYLVRRRAVGAFWSAVEEVRTALPELPILGSGPWAPYSFCDFALQPVLGGQDRRSAFQTQ